MAEHGSGSILYALVSRGAVVLAEYGSDKTDAARAAPRISRRIVEKIPGGDNRVTYSQDRHLYHILCENGIVYLAMAEESCGRRVPFGFLEDVKNRFHAQYGATARTALAYAYNTEFSRVLRQQMEYFSTNPNADAINRVKSEIAEVSARDPIPIHLQLSPLWRKLHVICHRLLVKDQAPAPPASSLHPHPTRQTC
mmetsp:Transcript_3648/g.9157  ORF Transcript_3648/g.9157 Transcript_3648/m.9157 type:complete len:196 (-) Transcript_3648:591-1178(-)